MLFYCVCVCVFRLSRDLHIIIQCMSRVPFNLIVCYLSYRVCVCVCVGGGVGVGESCGGEKQRGQRMFDINAYVECFKRFMDWVASDVCFFLFSFFLRETNVPQQN